MSLIKILLIAFGLVVLGMLAFPIIGFVYQALWYLFWIAIIGGGGYVAYRHFFKKSERAMLGENEPIGIDGLDSINREFEEIRRKYLTK